MTAGTRPVAVAEPPATDGKDPEARLLGGLVDAAHTVPPDGLVGLVADRCERSGLRDLVVQLQDYDQQQLVAVPVEGREVPAPERLDASMAGRAFTSHVMQRADRPDGVRLWAVMLDGTDRVGVLGVTVDDDDEPVRRLVGRLAGLVADMIVTKGAYSDVFFRLRRRRPMTLPAEMQWHLLPPLLMTTPRVSVAGALEPAYEVGGDAFDYALNGDLLHLAILDAVGHGLRAAVMAGVATASYRHARRADVGLEDVYAVMDEAVGAQAQPEEFVTAQVAELDTRTGALRWVNAGHPAPLLVRDRRVVGPLDVETTLPVGFGGARPVVATERLEPGDRVLFFTDGATEQRTSRGPRLGDELFEDLAERACSAGLIVAETVRRLVASLLDQNDGKQPDDDATVVLVEWRGPAG